MRISSKLMAILLFTSLIPLLFAGFLGYSSNQSIIEIAVDANQQIAQLAMTDSTAALSTEQTRHLKTLAQSTAGDINEILSRVEADTGQLADYATFLYNQPQAVNRYPVPSTYRADPERKMFGSVEPNDNSWLAVFSSGTDEQGNVTPAVLDEIYLTEFLDQKFKSIAATNPYAVQLYINTNSQITRGMPFIDGEYLWVDGIEQFNDAPDVTDFDFYYLADETHNPERKPVWTELYWDPAGLGWMVSSIAPVYRDETLMGVVGIDITLGKMIDQIINAQIEETGFAFLMSQSGQAIAFPERAAEFLGFEDSFSGDFGDNEQFSFFLTEANDARFQTIIRQMLAGAYDLTTYTHPAIGQEYFFAYHPVPLTGWSVGLVVPIQEVIAPALATNKQITANSETAIAEITQQAKTSTANLLFILAAIVALIIPVATIFARTISTPIKRLEDGSRRIGQGDLAHRIDIRSGDEIEELAKTFNQMASDLEAKLQEIERANAELRKLDELKSQFISMASHELRTPLIAIQGYVDLLQERTITDAHERQRMLETVSRNTNRLARIVTDLLDVAKIEENKLVLRTAPVAINEIIHEIAVEQKPSLAKRQHRLTLSLQPDLPLVPGDRDRLAQVIINLLGNAIKYTPDGGQIQIATSLEANNWVQISVKDNGIGIKAEDIGKLFQRFSTVGDITKHKSGQDEFMAGGTGLGLSIIKGIVEAHGGKVWVESVYGAGSTFYAAFPPLSPSNGDGRQYAPSIGESTRIYRGVHFERPPQSASSITTNGQAKILVIDDEEDILDVTRQTLDDRYLVITANTSATGLKEAMTKQPDLILLDVWMPGISGYDVCRTLKNNPKTRETPVIIFTAAIEQENEDQAREVGADGFITKPFKKHELISLIESFRKEG